MAEAITSFGTGAGFARYQLGAREEFIIVAASVLVAGPAAPPYITPLVEAKDPAGGVIYRQYLGQIEKAIESFYLAEGGEPWYQDIQANSGFPQDFDRSDASSTTMRMPRLPLGPGCTFGFYATRFVIQANVDPMDELDTNVSIQSPHLWVEDAAGLDLSAITVGNPILIGVGS